ncbi:hypothetical protein A3B21_03455 [Candidatus Uhrbacteria bacterium RIFCSPLOWO2_01_FULL_47_24]|uniref:Uncharacterized protein n=1 Tax=Candidatus Uhrbacteria bacterium RIFCSPLOWO2_01_FULL_47_24 TaxID=1802401 RepID=A0A1F7UT14_9BACT|nr:MAG: hypothetical protein A2753_05345 [Candidatus Uhrbacteria bacterium RIFCSPHIGHO2_01_FULL_47_11]OGL69070.1 MAG: hypothetical protein A3D58_04125 [Candidatus Uhrbacteria bacterium RIFCSPHIGHO2_02_FULL_46_47]OGL74613.1 MAG: hypothetical protein A3F52_01240 [Candidatus Uhrbacteria bacterium RIFCSPHIGHO2_12_FULL_47_11]OGL81440.1 MAG: hypothetical protein A3B21_03455 [Candidatus Uhrbacteria bacterium RIFCSPLOWO2_01_FULL_47_24]OGL83708.1 MAG: hypothetical protein A3J03_01625 [Candidatus Uhrbact
MIKRVFFSILILFAGILPAVVYAADSGSVTEDFGNTSRREERNTYAFWDTKNKAVSLPLQYSIRALTLPAESTISTPQTTSFAEVADRFSRIPVGKIKANALVAGDGKITFVADQNRLYASLAQGIELTGGRVAELLGAEVKTLESGEGKVLVGGKLKGKSFLVELELQGFVASAAAQSKKLASAGGNKYFTKATLTAEADLPTGTQIEYFLSGDGGAHFEGVLPSVAHDFTNKGNDLRFKAVLVTQDASATPFLLKVRVDYTVAEPETLATIRKRDSQRIADLKNIANALEKFKKERGVYPSADDQVASVRYELMGRLLIDGKFISKMPQDPKRAEDSARLYDYVASKNGLAYLLRAQLEETANKQLQKDVDAKPLEPNVYDYTCDDPWYCAGKGFLVVNIPPPPAPPAIGVAEILQDEKGRVWRIATVGGGETPSQKRKLYIPSPSLLSNLRNFYAQMRKVGREQIENVPRARLIKTADKDDIYYITETFLKRRIPSSEVFKSYGNDTREIVIVQPQELAAYRDSRLIRLVGDTRVWYLEGGARRLVTNAEVMKKYKFEWKHVAPVNFAEYNSYPEGAPLD